MNKILIIGNPNVGKSTLFNSLTKSSEHTGNFHGVTVEEKSKKITCNNQDFLFFDLPGMYSLNSASYEEEVAKNLMLKTDAKRFVLLDANCLRRNLYLCLQMQELDIDFSILINNYDYFKNKKNNINIKKLEELLSKNIFIINAKKIKINDFLKNNLKNEIKSTKNPPYLDEFIKKIKNFCNLQDNQIIKAINGIYENLTENQIEFIKNLYPEIIQARYKYIDEILSKSATLQQNYVYGLSKLDKFLLNPFLMIIGFFILFFTTIYLIFFLVGPIISNFLINLLNTIIFNPFLNFLYTTTDNIWILEFFKNGVISSFGTILSFLPQVALLFIALTILEDSGIIARLSYIFDDFLSKLGLNGKSIYVMLLGFGCNTVSCMATRNLGNKNLKIKTALINPYFSCMARLPVFVLIATAFFSKYAYLVVVGLYLLGIIVALVMAYFLNKGELKTKSNNLLLEFPPLRKMDIKHVLNEGKNSAIEMAKRIFTLVLSIGIIVWILSHTMFNFSYTDNITESVLYYFANAISVIFKPIGLNNVGVVSALIVGVMAKELILSTFSISNSTITNQALISSLVCATSVINFNVASAISFLIFSLLYCPCISNFAVIKKEIGKFYAWFSVILQLTVAYLLSFIVYNSLTKGVVFASVSAFIIGLIVFAIFNVAKRIKENKCIHCRKCK